MAVLLALSLAHRYNIVPPAVGKSVVPSDIMLPPEVHAPFIGFDPILYLTSASADPPVSLADTNAFI